MLHSSSTLRELRIVAVSVLLSAAALSQTIELDDGTVVTVQTKYSKPVTFSRARTSSFTGQGAAGLSFYTANYTSLKGKQLAFNIVGTDPSLGANTTTVPTVIVPLKFIFPNAGNPTLDGTNVAAATLNSPLFLTADYTTGGTDLGVTQYGDAIQRGEFYNLPGFSFNYHVLLGTPAVAPTVTVTVPSGLGNAYRLRSGGIVGVVDNNFFSAVLNSLLPAYTASQLPIFLTDNVFLGTNGVIQNCCVLGFHDSQGAPISTAQTWIYNAYTEPGTFTGNVIVDVQPLSHEVAEWLNDPFVSAFPGINFIPPAVLPGQGGACIINFETGDPLEAPPVAFTIVTNGTTYHLQDEVFLPWYLHSVPSFSVNGWYTFLNTFPSFSTLCGPG
jgi:hypothetical protein